MRLSVFGLGHGHVAYATLLSQRSCCRLSCTFLTEPRSSERYREAIASAMDPASSIFTSFDAVLGRRSANLCGVHGITRVPMLRSGSQTSFFIIISLTLLAQTSYCSHSSPGRVDLALRRSIHYKSQAGPPGRREFLQGKSIHYGTFQLRNTRKYFIRLVLLHTGRHLSEVTENEVARQP